MKIFQLIVLIATVTLTACNPNRVYETHLKDFPKYRWNKEKVLEYTPEIADTTATYRVYLELRHVYGFQFKTMKAKVTSISPSGESTTKSYEFPVFGADKQYLSDCSEDLCDLQTVVEESIRFKEAGKYTYKIEHEMGVDDLPNVMEFGLIIEKHEKKQ